MDCDDGDVCDIDRGTTACDDDGAAAMMTTKPPRPGAFLKRSLEPTIRDAPALHPSRPKPRPRRRLATTVSPELLLLALLALLLPVAQAVFINFENCLSPNYRNTQPRLLQFSPRHVWASFNTTAPSHNLNITIYGNVSGQTNVGPYPPPEDPRWSNANDTFGKIIDLYKSTNLVTTLFTSHRVLTYEAHTDEPRRFCETVINGECPLTPAFDVDRYNRSDVANLPAFSVDHDFYSTYSFATFASTMRIVSGDENAVTLGCISTSITPDLGSNLKAALRYLPMAVLLLVAIATIFAATCSPWGSWDIFRWSSNYGRDEDLLRLVTPGFGDCLQYIQFIVLAGSLNLQYPGFFQPVVSQASWSVLMFNQSFVNKSNGTQSLIDGIYFANGTYGLSRLGEYVGLAEDSDIWAGMAVWLLVIIAIITILSQIYFVGTWAYQTFTNQRGDGQPRSKQWPFHAGNIVRIVFNYFMLPIISLSLFQMVVAGRSPASVVATAVVLLLLVLCVCAWIFWMIFTTRPRAHLFDDMPTVLTYGPLYNTYSDDAAPFAFIPVLLTVMRGIAIGAIQPSGIAQIIILAICEVILILTLHAFRPFQSNTSMNAYHTFFSVIRLATSLLMVAFVPALGVTESRKGWIGYAILLMHGFVLVFGFFLNSLQTFIEVAARLAGAGADQRGGLTKVFGKRQLSRRHRRAQRSSLGSNAAMLHDADKTSIQLGRPRSTSGSSAILLNQGYGTAGSKRASSGFDNYSQGGDISYGGTTPGTPATNVAPWSAVGSASGSSSRRPTMAGALDATEHGYYRPPRPRKATLDSATQVAIAGRPGGPDLESPPYADDHDRAETGEGASSWSPDQSSITPAYLRLQRDDSDLALSERRKNTDYSVRESDFYYGLRREALSDQPTRKLKTGPADPMSPVSTATSWFRSLPLFGGKRKDKGKGFEVVRSTRLPPQMMALQEEDEPSPVRHEPYRDTPSTPRKRISPDGDEMDSDKSTPEVVRPDYDAKRLPDRAPSLDPIDLGVGIELPSRIGSRASRNQGQGLPERVPTIPRKSSRRTPSTDAAVLNSPTRLSAVADTPPQHSPNMAHADLLRPTDNTANLPVPLRLPFGSTEPSPSPERTPGQSEASSLYPESHASPGDELERNPLGVPPRVRTDVDRPLSTGYVHQHVARDSMRTGDEDGIGRTHLEASAAEFFERGGSVSTRGSGVSRRTG